MNVSFKQRTIDNKIQTYNGMIGHWVQMRNFLFEKIYRALNEGHPLNEKREFIIEEAKIEFDQIYGRSQITIGQVLLLCEDIDLSKRIHDLNEKFFHTVWIEMNYDDINKAIETLKYEAIQLISEMRQDIKKSTRFEINDFWYMVSWMYSWVPSWTYSWLSRLLYKIKKPPDAKNGGRPPIWMVPGSGSSNTWPG